MSDTNEYTESVQRALIRVVKISMNALSAGDPLAVERYFYITFRTDHDGVIIPEHLLMEYPRTMMIVPQNGFHNLIVDKKGFKIDLNFGKSIETIYVKFDAITNFTDPTSHLSLTFDSPGDEDDYEEEPEDNIIGFRSLTDAVKRTIADKLQKTGQSLEGMSATIKMQFNVEKQETQENTDCEIINLDDYRNKG